MTETTRLSASLTSGAVLRDYSRDSCKPPLFLSFTISKSLFLPTKSLSFHFHGKTPVFGGGAIRAQDFWGQEGGAVQELDESPVSIELESICSESQFDRVVAEAHQLEEPVIIVWMANWCRKCIYLKPKLEKLAADYYPRLRFYSVNVNSVPHKLVSRAGVTLWKDGKKQAELIGGHKAYLVVNEAREMIENECAL